MKKRNITMAGMLILLALLNSCVISFNSHSNDITGSKNLIEKTLDVKDFKRLDFSHSVTANIVQSDEYKVVIKYDDNLEQHLRVSKENGELSIGLKNGFSYSNTSIIVDIHMPDLNKIEASGACAVNLGEFSVSELELDLSGATAFNCGNIQARILNIDASGASAFNMNGVVESAKISCSGASDVNAKGFNVEKKLEIDASGASDMNITCNGEISIDASGASEIDFYGDGKIVKQSISGSSEINMK